MGAETPSPICDEPCPMACAIRSVNCVATSLKPTVFRLAKLFPTTSRAVLFALSPVKATENGFPIVVPPFLLRYYISGIGRGRRRSRRTRNQCLNALVNAEQLF